MVMCRYLRMLILGCVLVCLGCPSESEPQDVNKDSLRDDLDLPSTGGDDAGIVAGHSDSGTPLSDAGTTLSPIMDGGSFNDAGVLQRTCFGSYSVGTQAELDALSDCYWITGGLEITTNTSDVALAILEVNFPHLERIQGNVTIHFNQLLERVEFPVLSWVEGSFKVDQNNLLAELRTPLLETVDDDFFVRGNSALLNIDVSSLQLVHDSVTVQDNSGLTSLSFPKLDTVGIALEIVGNDNLAELSLATLGELAGDFEIRNNDYLINILANGLVGIWGDLDVRWNHSLRTFSLPDLGVIDGTLRVESNHSLIGFTLPELTLVNGPKIVMKNYSLPTCLIDRLLVQIDAVEGANYDADDVIIVEKNRGCRVDEVCDHVPVRGNCECTLNDHQWTATCTDPSGACEGDFYIAHDDNIEMLKDCTSISGKLSIERSRFIQTVTLPNLASLGDDLKIQDNTLLDSFALPNLVSIADGLTIMGNPILSTFEMSKLTTLNGLLLVTNNERLASCLIDPRLLTQLYVTPSNAHTTGNHDDCTCEETDGGLLAIECSNESIEE